MNRAVFDAFVAGFNAGRAVHGDDTSPKQALERAWQLYAAEQARRVEARYRKANRRADKEAGDE